MLLHLEFWMLNCYLGLFKSPYTVGMFEAKVEAQGDGDLEESLSMTEMGHLLEYTVCIYMRTRNNNEAILVKSPGFHEFYNRSTVL